MCVTESTIIDVLSAANETRFGPPHDRVSVISLGIDRYNMIIDSATGKSIEEVFSKANSHFSKETETNLNMLYALVGAKPSTLGLWLSPPIPDKGVGTGKILVAGKREINNQKQIVEYDVTGLDFTPAQFLQFHFLLKPYYKDGYYLIDEIPWDILSSVIPMSKAWEKMRNGMAEKEFRVAVDRWLIKTVGKNYEMIIPLIDKELGSNIRKACPTPGIGIGLISVSINQNGETLHSVRECPNCHYDVAGKHPEGIPAGWECPGCKGIYLGC